MKRRDFIKSTVALASAAAAAPMAGSTAARAEERARIQGYRPLGNTGMRISDISFGAGKLPSAGMILRAVDRGVNYFDTAPDYGPSEDHIGRALRRIPNRESIYIASKFCTAAPYPGHLPLGSSKQDYIASVDASLLRMGTDYLDVVFVHAIGEKSDLESERNRLLDENMLAAYETLKAAGKVRNLAVSSHGPHNMETLMLAAIESGHFDVIMPAFNFMKFPRVPELLTQAAARGVGVVAMKTLAGARDSGADLSGVFEHAAFRWVLKHPQVAGLVITIRTSDQLDLFVQASGQTFSQADQRALDRYAALHGSSYCRTGCGDCETACDQGIPAASILRFQMYFADYQDEKSAMQSYARLSQNAEACLGCETQACAGRCDHGLPVGEMLSAAHEQLSFPTMA